jgi:hypothetical protein
MAAAGKGHLAIVQYLLARGTVDPMARDEHGETAYDVAAINAEGEVCEELEVAERRWWSRPSNAGRNGEYDPLRHHSTFLILLHENQRATLTLPRLFMPSASRPPPSYTADAITVRDRRGPWTVLPRHQIIGAPEDVRLPLGDEWFWLTEWALDLPSASRSTSTVTIGEDGMPGHDDGWFYARTFEDPQWAPEPVVSGGGVRRRRWCRVMKKKVYLTAIDPPFPPSQTGKAPQRR